MQCRCPFGTRQPLAGTLACIAIALALGCSEPDDARSIPTRSAAKEAPIPLEAEAVPEPTPRTSASAADSGPIHWVGCGITKKAFMSALAREWKLRTGVEISMKGGGATRGIREVAAGLADMGGTCRHKIAAVEEVNCEIHPVGWDALAAVVHPDNPVDNIDLEKLRAVFAGRLTDWSELGGQAGRIELLVRDGMISGVGLMGRELLFANPTMAYAAGATQFKSSGPLEKSLEKNLRGIALSGISSAKKRALKVLTINNKSATPQDIISGDYPLSRPLYLVTAREPRPQVVAFLDFCQGVQGQKIVADEGTVSLAAGTNLWKLYRDRVSRTGGLTR